MPDTSTPSDFDQKVNKLLATITQQRQDVAAAEKLTKQPWVTNCSFKGDGGSTTTNIQVADMAQLHSLAIMLLLKRNAADAAATMLGITVPDPLYSGFTFEQWVPDLQKRAAIIQLNEKKRRLDELEARANQLVSPEQRRAMELAALEKLLADS